MVKAIDMSFVIVKLDLWCIENTSSQLQNPTNKIWKSPDKKERKHTVQKQLTKEEQYYNSAYLHVHIGRL